MFDTARLLTIFIQAGALISTFAGIVAGIIMANVTKRFGSGILASGFKSISIGIIFIALGIFTDAVQTYLQIFGGLPAVTAVIIVKDVFFIAGTYIIVIGSKKTGDKLESLTK